MRKHSIGQHLLLPLSLLSLSLLPLQLCISFSNSSSSSCGEEPYLLIQRPVRLRDHPWIGYRLLNESKFTEYFPLAAFPGGGRGLLSLSLSLISLSLSIPFLLNITFL